MQVKCPVCHKKSNFTLDEKTSSIGLIDLICDNCKSAFSYNLDAVFDKDGEDIDIDTEDIVYNCKLENQLK